MRRATLLAFRDPREQTPDARFAQLTNEGHKLLGAKRPSTSTKIGRE